MVFFILLSIVMMTVDHRQHHLETIRAGLSLVIYPLQLLVDLPTVPLRWASDNLTTRSELMEELEKLRTHNTLLKVQLQKLAAMEAENNRLRELFQSSKKTGERAQVAELIAVDLDPFTRQIVINKGSNDGAFLGQPLLDAHGVMGQLVHVAPFSSTAMLITDPSHAIPVQVNRTGLRAIVVGTGSSEQVDVPYIPNNADLTVGDLLITSGLGGRFPPGYPVARITHIENDPTQPYARVDAEPMAHLDHSREVLLVWPTENRAAATASSPANAEGETEQ